MKNFIKNFIKNILNAINVPSMITGGLVTLVVFAVTGPRNAVAPNTKELENLKSEVQDLKETSLQKKNLIEFTLTAMDMAPKSKISSAKREIVAEKLVNYTIKYLPNQDSREQYISMIKIESNFENTARSPVGAQGIGQIMPSTFNGVIKTMDIKATPEDIANEDVNLMVGAYYFNTLLTEQRGNPRLASIAYNGGSKVAESFKKMNRINQESANYGLLTEHVKETVREKVIADDKAGIVTDGAK
jgi:hypothetical protein